MMMKALWIYCKRNKNIINDVCIINVANDQAQCISLICMWMKWMIISKQAKWSILKNCANWLKLIKWWIARQLHLLMLKFLYFFMYNKSQWNDVLRCIIWCNHRKLKSMNSLKLQKFWQRHDALQSLWYDQDLKTKIKKISEISSFFQQIFFSERESLHSLFLFFFIINSLLFFFLTDFFLWEKVSSLFFFSSSLWRISFSLTDSSLWKKVSSFFLFFFFMMNFSLFFFMTNSSLFFFLTDFFLFFFMMNFSFFFFLTNFLSFFFLFFLLIDLLLFDRFLSLFLFLLSSD